MGLFQRRTAQEKEARKRAREEKKQARKRAREEEKRIPRKVTREAADRKADQMVAATKIMINVSKIHESCFENLKRDPNFSESQARAMNLRHEKKLRLLEEAIDLAREYKSKEYKKRLIEVQKLMIETKEELEAFEKKITK